MKSLQSELKELKHISQHDGTTLNSTKYRVWARIAGETWSPMQTIFNDSFYAFLYQDLAEGDIYNG